MPTGRSLKRLEAASKYIFIIFRELSIGISKRYSLDVSIHLMIPFIDESCCVFEINSVNILELNMIGFQKYNRLSRQVSSNKEIFFGMLSCVLLQLF